MADGPAPRWRAVVGRAALAVFLFGCMVIVIGGAIGGGPIDYRMIGTVGGWTLACSSVLVLPAFAIRMARGRTVTPLSRWRVTAFVAVGVAAVAAVCVWRGVVTPWAPVASETAAACPALERAGLAQAWPDAPRDRTRDDVDHNDLGVFSYCGWTVDTPDDNPQFKMLSSFVWLYEGTRISTALGWATGEYRDRYDDATLARKLDGIGEEAFVADAGDRVTVVARRANVLMQVEIYPSSSDAARIAENLVRQMATGVRTS